MIRNTSRVVAQAVYWNKVTPFRRATICVLAILTCVGCGDYSVADQGHRVAPLVFSADTLASYQLSGDVFSSSENLGRPGSVVVAETRLYVRDSASPTSRSVLIFDRNTGRFLKSAVDQGEGPLEMNRLRSLDFKPGRDTGWLYDASQRKFQFFAGDSLTDQIVRLEDSGFVFGAVTVTGDSIASSGTYEAGRLAIHSPSGDFVRFLGPAPPGDPNIPVPVRNHAYQSWLETNSDGSRVVSAVWNSDRIEIFGSSGLLSLTQGPGLHEPQYTMHSDQEGNSWHSLDDETIIGYLSVDTTDEYIFALYCGRTMGWSRGTGTGVAWGDKVIVLDWDGVPHAILYIEDGATRIGISGDGTELYAIYRRPAPLILHYEVPEIG